MRPHIIFLCLCLLALAVNVRAEENTETEVDSPRSKEEQLPERGKTKLDTDINIDGTNTDDDTGTDHEDDADPIDREETNYNGDSDNEGFDDNEENNDGDNEDNYEDDKSGKADEAEPAPEEAEEADTEREGFSPNEGGSRVAQGTADSNDAASPVDVQNAGAGSPSNKASMVDLPPDSSLSALSNRGGSSQSLGLSPGSQSSQAPSAEVVNSVPALPALHPLLPVSSPNSQNGQSNPSPNTGSGAVANSDTSNPLPTNTQAQTFNGLPPLVPNNNLAPVNSNTPMNLPPLVPNSNLAPANDDALKNLPPLVPNNQAPVNYDTPKSLPPLIPNNNQAPVNYDTPKSLPPLIPNNNQAPMNYDTPKSLPPLMPNNNQAPVNYDTPKSLPPLIPNNNQAPVNYDTPKSLPPLMPNNNQAPPVNSPGITAGGPAPFQQPSLPNSPFSSGVAGQASYGDKDGTMTGNQNQGANALASSPGSQDTALSGLQAQNFGSLLAPGPVILASGRPKTEGDGLEFPDEAKPSPTAVLGREDFNYQTGLRTTLSPWRGFGDLSYVPTSQVQISEGDEAQTGDTEDLQHGDDLETSEDDPERERPQHHDEAEYQYNSDDDLGAQSQQVDEGEAGDKDGKATSDNDDNTDDYYEDDYFGKGKEEGGTEEKSFQAQYQDPGHNVLEEPKTDGESKPGSEDVEMGAVDMTTMKTKAPNKPTNMVLFYTWLILVVLIAVVTISTCKTRIVGLFNRAKKSTSHPRQPQPEEGKRLLEHEYV